MTRSNVWVFAYGSLLWDPGFVPSQVRPATLSGYCRSFCMWSVHHRGTPDRPGLVLALDQKEGAVCQGQAMRIADEDTETVLAALRRRELVSSAYIETKVQIEVEEYGSLEAITYIVDRHHRQYCQIRQDQQARIIATASGGRGHNREYLEKTVNRLRHLGIGDPALETLCGAVQRFHVVTDRK